MYNFVIVWTQKKQNVDIFSEKYTSRLQDIHPFICLFVFFCHFDESFTSLPAVVMLVAKDAATDETKWLLKYLCSWLRFKKTKKLKTNLTVPGKYIYIFLFGIHNSGV